MQREATAAAGRRGPQHCKQTQLIAPHPGRNKASGQRRGSLIAPITPQMDVSGDKPAVLRATASVGLARTAVLDTVSELLARGEVNLQLAGTGYEVPDLPRLAASSRHERRGTFQCSRAERGQIFVAMVQGGRLLQGNLRSAAIMPDLNCCFCNDVHYILQIRLLAGVRPAWHVVHCCGLGLHVGPQLLLHVVHGLILVQLTPVRRRFTHAVHGRGHAGRACVSLTCAQFKLGKPEANVSERGRY